MTPNHPNNDDLLELYVYSTEKYLREGIIKVGHTLVGRSDERIHEQQGTANPDAPIKLLVEPLPMGTRDSDIHRILESWDIERLSKGAGREWFKTTVDKVQKALNQLRFGCPRTNSYTLRKEQADAVTKATRWFHKEYDDFVVDGATHKNRFLLNAKMRFGKCFTGLHVAKNINAKNTLIVTYKPEVIGEWLDTVTDHVDFDGWTGARGKKFMPRPFDLYLSDTGKVPKHDGPFVLCASLQDLSIEDDGTIKPRLKEVLKRKWDLIIYDEVHYGSGTTRAKYIIDKINAEHRLDLSGTPFRLIQFDDFCPEQVFTYSYLDEQENKRHEVDLAKTDSRTPQIYRSMPDLDISTIEITEADLNKQIDTFFTDDLDFSLNELFRVSNKNFANEDAVRHFIEGLCNNTHEARAISVFGKLGSKLNVPAVRHSVWWLNRVDSVKALSKLLKQHHYFKDFEIILAAGGTGDELDDEVLVRDKEEIQKKIKKVCTEGNKKGTITLTVRRFLTGVTIKEWDSILILSDVKSAESYFQAIFRVQSAWLENYSKKVIKPKAWVFDFAISRCLRTTYEYADALADQLDQKNKEAGTLSENIDTVVEGLCSTLDIKRFYEGSLTSSKTVAKDIFEALNLSGSRIALAKRITSDALLNFSSLQLLEENPDLLEALKRIKGYRTQEPGGIEDFVKIGIEASELEERKKSDRSDEEIEEDNEHFVEDEKDKEKKSKKKWVATQIKRLAICMADFVYMTQFREHKIDHVINTKDPLFFNVVTGISKDEFSKLCELGFINRNALNRIVNEFRRQEESSLKPEEFIFGQLGK